MSVIGAVIAALAAGQTPSASLPNVWDILEPERVCEVSQTWIIGVGHPMASTTHSHVDRLEIEGRAVFQAIHRSTDPLDTSHDLFVVEAETLHPIRTRHTGPDPDVAFEFAADRADRLSETGEIVETTALDAVPMAEGPGMEIIVQAVPWREGLSFSGLMLDRWRGEGDERARPFVWRVAGIERITTADGAFEVFRTELAPTDGTFSIVEFISTERPHRVIRTEYRHSVDRPVLASETRRHAAWCGATAA